MHKKNIDTINTYAFQFLRLKSAFDLSKLLCFEFSSFVGVIENASYRKFSIPKAKGGKRIIEAPNENLLQIQKRLNICLQAVYYTIKPTEVYGFVQSAKAEAHNHNIITNAKNHIGKASVLNIDLKDFFHSISAIKVRELFQTTPFYFSEDLATCLALICCWNKRLPMGAATSPVVSNFHCLKLDEQLIAVARQLNLTYTRYADDLTFSTNYIIDETAINNIKQSISESEFNINERKFRLQSKYRQQSVTGIKVNTKANVDRPYIRNIRAALHDITLNGLEKAAIKHYKTKQADEKLIDSFLSSLTGKINFIGQVRGKDDLIYNRFKQELRVNVSTSLNHSLRK